VVGIAMAAVKFSYVPMMSHLVNSSVPKNGVINFLAAITKFKGSVFKST
jgi:hypothetical protein